MSCTTVPSANVARKKSDPTRFTASIVVTCLACACVVYVHVCGRLVLVGVGKRQGCIHVVQVSIEAFSS